MWVDTGLIHEWEHWFADHLSMLGVLILGGLGLLGVLKRKLHDREGRRLLQKAIKTSMNEPLTLHPEINAGTCAGCGTCVKSCPEGEILKLIDHKAVLVSPTKCVGHGECEAACPTGAIKLVFGTKTRGMDIPRITAH